MILRITLEYDTDGRSIGEEITDWIDGNVDFHDLWELRSQPDVKIYFNEVETTES